MRISGGFWETKDRLYGPAISSRVCFTNLIGYRFDGTRRFGDGFLFDQDGVGMLFPRFRIASSFSHFSSIESPPLRINGGFREMKGRLYMPSISSSIRFTYPNGLGLPGISVSAAFGHSEGLGGKITMDSWAGFDGKINFDSARTFNTYIKEEEL